MTLCAYLDDGCHLFLWIIDNHLPRYEALWPRRPQCNPLLCNFPPLILFSLKFKHALINYGNLNFHFVKQQIMKLQGSHCPWAPGHSTQWIQGQVMATAILCLMAAIEYKYLTFLLWFTKPLPVTIFFPLPFSSVKYFTQFVVFRYAKFIDYITNWVSSM